MGDFIWISENGIMHGQNHEVEYVCKKGEEPKSQNKYLFK